jgi:hypothetical protein
MYFKILIWTFVIMALPSISAEAAYNSDIANNISP